MEILFAILRTGNIYPRKKSSIEKDKQIRNQVETLYINCDFSL